jgi:hypothetical protein
MNAQAARRENRALISAWSRSVFLDREYVGRIHPADGGGWIAEFRGRVLGIFREERHAVAAVLDAQRRAAA